jgi:hypothetical protein
MNVTNGRDDDADQTNRKSTFDLQARAEEAEGADLTLLELSSKAGSEGKGNSFGE